jgi:hypothetical protein
MRWIPEGVMLLMGLAACAGNRSEEVSETTRTATDTLVTSKRIVDTLVVKTDSTIATDTTIVADTTIAVDTSIAADTTVAADTTRVGNEGVISVDTTKNR